LFKSQRRRVATRLCIFGAEDAPYIEREFGGTFDQLDLVQLGNYRIYLKLMIDSTPSHPFSATTLPA
jgi:hypothetical protein